MKKRRLTTSAGAPVGDNRNSIKLSGDADRYDHREGNDDYMQPGNLYRLLPKDERERLHKALANAMRGVPREIVECQLGHFEKADPAYAKGVRAHLK